MDLARETWRRWGAGRLSKAPFLRPHFAKWAGLYVDFTKREKSKFREPKTKNAWSDILSARHFRGEYRRTDTPASHRGDHP